MISLLGAVLLVAHSCTGLAVDTHSDANIYPYVVSSLQELKALQEAERLGIHFDEGIIQRASSVCYDDLGCFDKNATFKHLRQLPDPPELVNTQFLLYTRKNPTEPQFLDRKKPETVLESNINPKVPLKFLTHGFGGKTNMTWLMNMKNAFLKKEDLNVIVVDWNLGARVPYYIQASVNSELVGAETAVLYYFIKDKMGILEKDLHCVGFSLGAHVVGFIGKRMQELRGTRPARITGLDPASPLFEDYGGEVHLFKDDADFVDVVHTNADLLLYGGVGMGIPIGHVDYYPNGGKRQPGCGSTIGGAFIDMFTGDRGRTCNHERAVHLFTDSILDPYPCKYTGYKCSNYSDFELGKCMSCDSDDCGEMGYSSKGTGIYYLMTKAEHPFCAEVAKLTVRFPKGIKRSYGSIILTLTGKNGEKENVTLTEKDEKLSASTEKQTAVALNDGFKPLSAIQVLYLKYNGWFAKGTDTFSMESVTIKDKGGEYIYKSCGEEVVLKDNEYLTLKQTDASC